VAAIQTLVTVWIPRIVVDYSGRGRLNERLAKWPMTMFALQRFVAMLTPGCFVATHDMQAGFYQMVVAPWARPSMAFAVDGLLLQPIRMMFGPRIGPAIFSVRSGFICALANCKCILNGLHRVFSAAYFDDDATIAATDACAAGLAVLDAIMDRCGRRFEASKRQPPSQDFVLLGIRFNTVTMQASLPLDKRFNTLQLLACVIRLLEGKHQVPRDCMRKLAGKLCWASLVVTGDQARLYRLWAACETSADMNVDALLTHLRWWLERLADPALGAAALRRSPALDPDAQWVSSQSDASGDTACAIRMGGSVWHHTWTPTEQAYDITYKGA
jgi:hypothetical protein